MSSKKSIILALYETINPPKQYKESTRYNGATGTLLTKKSRERSKQISRILTNCRYL